MGMGTGYIRGGLGMLISSAVQAVVFAAISLVGAPRACAEKINYAVARVIIYPGETVTAALLVERQLERGGQGFATKEQALGKVTRRTLLPGQLIALGALRPPDVVRSGKPVRLVYSADDLEITAQGLALQSGAAGDIVSVQSSDSNVIVRGRAQPDGTVRLEE